MTPAHSDAQPRPHPHDRRAVWVAVVILLVQAGLLARGAVHHAPTWDEVGHLSAGISHWRSGYFDAYRVNPPLARLVATWPAALAGADVDWDQYEPEPWNRTEFTLGRDLIDRYGPDSLWYLTICRWAVLPLAVLGGWVCFVWARQLHGDLAGLAAVTLWAFSPFVLAHGQLITPDVASAALGVLACYAFWRWLGRPSWPRAVGMGFALGLALFTKFTLLILAPTWLAIWGCLAVRRRAGAGRQAVQLAAAYLLSLYVINVGFVFEATFRPLGDFPFVSQVLAGYRTGRDGNPWFGNRFAGTWLGRVPVPVPANYLQGIDVQWREIERSKELPSYLGGEWRVGGWWYYYLYGLAVKEPAGTLALAVLAIATALRRRPPPRLSGDLLPLVCGALVVALVSSQVGFSGHVRYVLPALPLFYVFFARVFAPGRPRWVAALGACCVVASAVSSLRAYPHSLSYFNELAGGPAAGPRHLHDSNLDWGQDLLYLKAWCDRHPDRRPLYVVYSGGFDPARLRFWGEGVHHEHEAATWQALADDKAGPCWYAIFVGRLLGPPTGRDVFARFRGREPDERLGDTVYIYYQAGPEAGGPAGRTP